MQTVSDNATVIEIKGASYAVEAIDAGECGRSAVRVVKLVNGESYDVIRTHAGVVECTCPDFVCRHEGKGSMCKHGAACLANGLLVAPVAAPAPEPVVAPITPKDVKRARMWGLKLPVAPAVKPVVAPIVLDLATTTTTVAAPASDPIVRTTAIRPADVREMAEWLAVRWIVPAVAPVVEANPRDSWGAWTDADCWTTEAPSAGPVALASDDESTGIDLTAFASRMAAVGDEAPSPVYTMPALGGPVVVRPELVGLPPAVAPMAWVEVGPRAYQMVNLTPIATDYREHNRELDRRSRPSRGFVPTLDEATEAALLFADRRSSCLEGETSPPPGRRFKAPTPRPAWVGVNNMTDADVHPHGVC